MRRADFPAQELAVREDPWSVGIAMPAGGLDKVRFDGHLTNQEKNIEIEVADQGGTTTKAGQVVQDR